MAEDQNIVEKAFDLARDAATGAMDLASDATAQAQQLGLAIEAFVIAAGGTAAQGAAARAEYLDRVL
jgi:hypothetical protein